MALYLIHLLILLAFAIGISAEGHSNNNKNLRKTESQTTTTTTVKGSNVEHAENFAKHLEEAHIANKGVFGILSLIDSSKALQSAPQSSSSTSSSSKSYIQILGRKKSNCDGNSEVMSGLSMLLNTCFFVGQFSSSGIPTPYYAKIVLDSTTGIYFNATYSLDSDCSTTLSTYLLPYPEGCSKVSGDSLIKSMKVTIVDTVYWPTGAAYVLHDHTTSSECAAEKMKTFSTYSKFTDCNAAIDKTTGAKVYYQVSTCSGSSFTFDFYPTSGCSGNYTSSTTVGPTGLCEDFYSIGGVAGYYSLTCLNGTPHNKCYNAIGMSTPPCVMTSNSNGLKFQCQDPSYTSCLMYAGTDAVFACCT